MENILKLIPIILLAITKVPCAEALSAYVTIDGDTVEEGKEYNSTSSSESYGLAISSGASYTATDVDIYKWLDNSFGGGGIYSNEGKFLNFGASTGLWATVTADSGYRGSYATGITLQNMSDISTIYNTRVYNKGNQGSGVSVYNSKLFLDNVEVYISDHTSNNETGIGLAAQGGATISNKGLGLVKIVSDSSGQTNAAVSAAGNSTVDLINAAIHVNKTSNAYGGILSVSNGGTISLTDSTIVSAEKNTLISLGSNSTVNLSNMELSRAKNQQIITVSTNTKEAIVNIQDGTHFDGYTSDLANSLNIMLEKSGWTVTQDSTLFSISLEQHSFLDFKSDGENGFKHIASSSVFIEQGCWLMLDIGEDTILSLVSSGDEFQLFSGNLDTYEVNNVTMYSSDGLYRLNYQEGQSGKGWFQITGFSMIPEPTTATLSLLGFMCIIFRRRKN